MNQRIATSSTGSVVNGSPAVFHEPDMPGLPLISVNFVSRISMRVIGL